MAELKPCPFCGGEAELRHEHSATGFSYIKCVKCHLSSPMFPRSYDKASDEVATNFWNRRAEDGR